MATLGVNAMDKKPLKEEKYNVIYWPSPLLELKRKAYDLLLEIDCNYSRLLQSLLYSIITICKFIIKQKKNFRHYEWQFIIKDRKTGLWHSTLPAGTYQFESLGKKEKKHARRHR